MIHNPSLAKTIDTINEAFFHNQSTPRDLMQEIVEWLCQQQVKSGSNTGIFMPTETEIKEGITLFTGEKLKTKLASRNILTQEAARILILSKITSEEVQKSILLANNYLFQSCFSDFCDAGECRHSTVGFIRYLATEEKENSKTHIKAFLNWLTKHRGDNGKWKGFPFYYTLLTLSEISIPPAISEMQYAAPAYERCMKRESNNGKFSQRRRTILQNIPKPKTGFLDSFL